MLINLQGVALSHDDTTVLHHVDFQVNENDFVYIIGKVGSGKSTLLKALYGEVPVQEGSAQIFDVDLTRLKNRHLPSLRRRLGIVFQDFQLLRHHTVEQNLDFVLRATGWKKKLRPELLFVQAGKIFDLPEPFSMQSVFLNRGNPCVRLRAGSFG